MKNINESFNFQYYLMPGKCPKNFEHIPFYNRIYTYWKIFWEDILKNLDGTTKINSDEFLRQDIVPVIMNGDEIVAIHLYTTFDLRCQTSIDHSYIAGNYPHSFIERLMEREATHLMSMEYLTVSPSWRKSRLGYSMAHVLLGLGLNVLKYEGLDAGIAPTRQDYKMHELAYTYGFDQIIPDVMMHNVKCDLVACFPQNIKHHPNLQVNRVVHELWENRIDLIHGTHKSDIPQVAA